MNRRNLSIMAVILLLIGGMEMSAYRWMNPPTTRSSPVYPVFPAPISDENFEPATSGFSKVKPILSCSNGWMGAVAADQPPTTFLAWFEWDRTSAINTLEAFKHMPDQCMGSNGMELQRIYEPRVFGEGEKKMIFDSTRFRPARGSQSVFVFKAVWVSGWAGANLRTGVIDGVAGSDWRKLRYTAAKTRFRPDRTRVLMGTVVGFPTEDLAWRWFHDQSLKNLRWVESAPGA